MPLSRLLLVSAALIFTCAGAAQAFTIEGGPGANGSASRWQDLDMPKANAADPDSRFKRTDDGRVEFKSGNSSFYFGQQRPMDERYSTDNLFNPFARDGR